MKKGVLAIQKKLGVETTLLSISISSEDRC